MSAILFRALHSAAPSAPLKAIGRSIISNVTTNKVSQSLKEHDSELYNLICEEQKRQRESIALIASENYVPRYCSEGLASCLSSRYSEGFPKSRYYAGNELIDDIETLCQKRALQAFRADPAVWGCNVQALSGSPANFAVFTGLLGAGDRIMYLDLPHGGHLSHGFETAQKKLTATSKFFTCMPYRLDLRTQLIDYDEMELLAQRFKPKMLIAGYSAYPRLLDYKRFRDIADSCGALLLADIAHISGPMAAGQIPSAFEYADIVTTTTHKTLRGPRGALIFFKKELADAINTGVFPGVQGGPHNHTIGAVATALKAAAEPEFEQYQKQVLKNAQVLAQSLQDQRIKLVTGGTDNHLLLADFSGGLRGQRAEKALETVNIVANKNTVPSDTSAKNPSGVRMGTPAMTTRGFTEKEFKVVGDLIGVTVKTALELDPKRKMKNKDFAKACESSAELAKIRQAVVEFASKFPCAKSVIFPAV